MENYHAYFARRVYLDIPPEEVFTYEGCEAPPKKEKPLNHWWCPSWANFKGFTPAPEGERVLPFTLAYLTTPKEGTNGTTQQV